MKYQVFKSQFYSTYVALFIGLGAISEKCFGSPVLVGPCHHGMERPQVADRGTASDKEGSCE